MSPTSPLTLVVDEAVLPSAAADRIRSLANIELIDRMSPAALERADVVFTRMGTFDPADAPRLQWVQTESASIAHLTETKLAASGLPVANARGALSPNVAELAIGLLLALTRRLTGCHRLQAEGVWPEVAVHQALYGDACYGRTLGVLGYGSIGRQVARIASGLGMSILACTRSGQRTQCGGFHLPNTGDMAGELPVGWFGPAQLEEMLPGCDAVVMSLPLTAATRHLIGGEQLGWLPRHAFLVDVGRGGVLDLDALHTALLESRLAGAALDVYEQEPLPSAHPLWRAPNLIMSPHIGAGTKNRNDFVAEVLIENLSRCVSNRPLLNLVDFRRGY